MLVSLAQGAGAGWKAADVEPARGGNHP